jgi:hypothetical protein
MKHITLVVVALLCSLHVVVANVYVTEIMHSPNQMADSDGEWVELYNDGLSEVNVSNWTINNKDFDDVTIQAGEYLVVARELIDGTDTDTDSFESYWGNNNGVWDESFLAVDGSLSLTAEGSVVLSNGIYSDNVTYNATVGGTNDRTIERVSLTEWVEGVVDGTPGEGTFSTTTNNGNGVNLVLTVNNSEPVIEWVNITTDDSSSLGIQVMPNVLMEKEVNLEVSVIDVNGLEAVSVRCNNKGFNLTLIGNVYTGVFVMDYFDLAGMYNVTVEVFDGSNTVTKETTFEYLGMIATTVNTTDIELSVNPGESSEQRIQIINSGNVLVDTEVLADDFASEDSVISADNIEVFSSEWLPLYESVLVDMNIIPLDIAEVLFRVNVPDTAKSGSYKGRIVVNSMESE